MTLHSATPAKHQLDTPTARGGGGIMSHDHTVEELVSLALTCPLPVHSHQPGREAGSVATAIQHQLLVTHHLKARCEGVRV